jgi:hypothetical protein
LEDYKELVDKLQVLKVLVMRELASNMMMPQMKILMKMIPIIQRNLINKEARAKNFEV